MIHGVTKTSEQMLLHFSSVFHTTAHNINKYVAKKSELHTGGPSKAKQLRSAPIQASVLHDVCH